MRRFPTSSNRADGGIRRFRSHKRALRVSRAAASLGEKSGIVAPPRQPHCDLNARERIPERHQEIIQRKPSRNLPRSFWFHWGAASHERNHTMTLNSELVIRTCAELSPGDEIEARFGGRAVHRGTVTETRPVLGLFWITEPRIGGRRLVDMRGLEVVRVPKSPAPGSGPTAA